MSGKESVEERLIISAEKHKKWENRFVECFNEMRNKIRAQLLTTMEVAFPEGNKLEALKSRIRDIQGRTWRKIFDAHNRVFKRHFSVIVEGEALEKPTGEETKPTWEEYKKKVETFFKELDGTIYGNMNHFDKLIDNLIVLAEERLPKQEVLKETANGITNEIYGWIRAWLEGTIYEVFEIK